MCVYGLCLFYAGLFFVPGQASAKNPVIDVLGNAPKINGQVYKCADMAHVVNHLRQLGRDKSLAALRDYLDSDRDPGKVLQVRVICRLLFVNPKGWEPVTSGNLPTIDEAAMKPFPLFPIAISNGVPFLLVEGYQGGRISATDCLKLCEGFAMVKEDYPVAVYEKAARWLTETDVFRQLYQEADRQAMTDMILNQAKAAKAPEKK